MPAFGMPAGFEMVVLLAVLLIPVVIVILALRLTRKERRDVGFPVEPVEPPNRAPDDR